MNDQAEHLRRMLHKKHEGKRAQTIAVASGKGGVGKSNLSLNMALELINHNQKVLLFDLDVGMGSIDVLLGLNSSYSVVDWFQQSLSIYDTIVKGPGGLSCITGGSGLNHVFVTDLMQRNRFYNAYTELAEDYDYIFLDLGSGVTPDSLLFMLAADDCLIVTTPEPTAITDAYSMVKHLVMQGFTKQIHILMNRTNNDKQGRMAMDHFAKVADHFLHVKLNKLGILPEDRLVPFSVMKQTPFLFVSDKAPISKAIKRVVECYLNHFPESKPSKRMSFVEKLKQLMVEGLDQNIDSRGKTR